MMTNSPDDKNELIIQNTQLAPIDPRDSRTDWQKFVDGLRQTIGLKPIYLAERWAEAKVRQEENDAEAKLLAAKANYELAMAQVRKMDRESLSKQVVDAAITDYIRSHTDSPDIVLSVLKNLMGAASTSPEDALEALQDVIKRIELKGGTVEFDADEEADDESDR